MQTPAARAVKSADVMDPSESLAGRSAQWRNETDVGRIKVALAVMSNAELDALSKATYNVEQIAPGLLAWLD